MRIAESIKINPMYKYLMLLAIVSSSGLQGWHSLYNNFAVDYAHVNGFQTGIIQSFRELPGFLSLLVIYLLLVIKEHKLAALSILVFGIGVMLTGVFPSFWGLLITTFIMSVGFHYFEAVNQSLILQNFNLYDAPTVMGKYKSYSSIANIIVGVVIWVLVSYSGIFKIPQIYLLTGGLTILAAIYGLSRNPRPNNSEPQIRKIMFKKKYWLYYLLSFFSGARRQILIVFAVFLLVSKYHFTVENIALLFILNNALAYFVNPLVARSINRFGERKVLTMEYSCMILVFLSYAFIEIGWVAALLYMLDNMFFSFAMSINTYLQKTAEPRDISSTVATGFTINHISAVIIPVVGGILWMLNFRLAFFAGAGFAACSLILTQFILPRSVTKQ